jgi:hypothetical protein
MLSRADIKKMEKIVIEHSGPMGVFVIRKAIKDLGAEPADFDEETRNKFVTMVLERSIFDPAKREPVRALILGAWKKA